MTLAGYRPDWHARAECRGQDLDDFFVDDVALRAGRAPVFTWPVIRAKDVCADCPVRIPCLQEAFRLEDQTFSDDDLESPSGRRYGVYGGMTGRERELVAHDPARVEILLGAFEMQRRRWNLGSIRRRPRRELEAVG